MPQAEHYIYTLHPARLEMLTAGPTAEEADIISRHATYLEDLAEKGVVVLAGRTQTRDADTFGIVIVNAESEAEARVVMENDPGVKYGVQRAKLYPFRIAAQR